MSTPANGAEADKVTFSQGVSWTGGAQDIEELSDSVGQVTGTGYQNFVVTGCPRAMRQTESLCSRRGSTSGSAQKKDSNEYGMTGLTYLDGQKEGVRRFQHPCVNNMSGSTTILGASSEKPCTLGTNR